MLTVPQARNSKREFLPLCERSGASTHRVCDFARALVQLSVHHVRLPIPEGDFIPDVPEITLHTADGSVWDNPSGFSLLYTSSSDLIISERRKIVNQDSTESLSHNGSICQHTSQNRCECVTCRENCAILVIDVPFHIGQKQGNQVNDLMVWWHIPAQGGRCAGASDGGGISWFFWTR
jgi:hypothetical protein